MRIDGREESDNVEDRRGASPGGIAVTGGAGMLLLMLIVWLLGGNPLQLLQQMPQQPGQVGQPMPGGAVPPGQEELTHFVKVVLRDSEVVWDDIFRQHGQRYRYPKLVLFSGRVESACGFASAAVGPFYCPADERVYLDLGFFREMKERFGATGDFAQAYVIAHEIGHHVQKILGISDQVEAARRRMGEREANQLSVRLELQADFFAGYFAGTRKREKPDFPAAVFAMTQYNFGDNMINHPSHHGTPNERAAAIVRGFEVAYAEKRNLADAISISINYAKSL